MKGVTLLTLALLSVAAAVPASPRDERVLSLFSVVNFANDECQPTTTAVKDATGTCFSTTECTDKGGTNSGKCASGFGICCTFFLSTETGGTVSHNLTVVENEKYPTPLTAATKTITYTINTVNSDICMLRFDFIAFDLGVTAVTGACTDQFTVTSPSGKNPPVLCGMNAGYHLYSDVGRSATATTAVVTTDASTTTNRSWRIKISQIECDNPSRPQTGCAQYFTKESGGFESFNFMGSLMTQGQDMTVCFRKNYGMCSIDFKVDMGSATPDPFQIELLGATGATMSKIAEECTAGRIGINGQAQCGAHLNQISGVEGSGSISANCPFTVTVYTPAADLQSSTGYKLRYSTSSTNC